MGEGAGRRYKVGGVLGAGGFGTVYAARMIGEAGFVRDVALKVLHEGEVRGDRLARLRDEARLLGRVRHPGLVGVDALVRLEDRWTVVMELAPGWSVDRVFGSASDGRSPVPPRAALELVGKVAATLDAVHRAEIDGKPLGLVHRDLKPSNLQLSRTGDVVLLDFGIARADFDEREARTGQRAFGTPAYMAPERLELVDGPAGDVYALGVTLVELLTGARPDRATARPDAHRALLDRLLAATREAWPDEELSTLLSACLAYEDGHRPSAAEVASRCRALAVRAPGADLPAWSSLVVGADPPSAAGPLTGRTLTEQATEEQAPSETFGWLEPTGATGPTASASMERTGQGSAPVGSALPATSAPRRGTSVGAVVALVLGSAGVALLAGAVLVAVTGVVAFAGAVGAVWPAVAVRGCVSMADEASARLREAGASDQDLRLAAGMRGACTTRDLGMTGADVLLLEIQRATADGRFDEDEAARFRELAELYGVSASPPP